MSDTLRDRTRQSWNRIVMNGNTEYARGYQLIAKPFTEEVEALIRSEVAKAFEATYLNDEDFRRLLDTFSRDPNTDYMDGLSYGMGLAEGNIVAKREQYLKKLEASDE